MGVFSGDKTGFVRLGHILYDNRSSRSLRLLASERKSETHILLLTMKCHSRTCEATEGHY